MIFNDIATAPALTAGQDQAIGSVPGPVTYMGAFPCAVDCSVAFRVDVHFHLRDSHNALLCNRTLINGSRLSFRSSE